MDHLLDTEDHAYIGVLKNNSVCLYALRTVCALLPNHSSLALNITEENHML
jgi:hypothetical protein